MSTSQMTLPQTEQKASVTFFVAGRPVQKGSKRAMVHPHTGRAMMLDDNREKLRQWASDVKTAAAAACMAKFFQPLGDAVGVRIEFRIPRPKAHFFAGGKLRAGAPQFCGKRPDIDKLARATIDALSGIVFRDDSQIAVASLAKLYAERPGAEIEVWGL